MTVTQSTHVQAKSVSLHKSAGSLMPGGLASAFAPWYGEPIWWRAQNLPLFSKGRGAILTDVDGNDYVDLVCAHGAALLGHADDRVVAALSKAAAKGVAFGAACDLEPRLVELIIGRYPGAEQVRLVDTPMEALQTAVSLCRHHRNRRYVLVSEGYGVNGMPALCESGSEQEAAPAYFTAPFNDIKGFEQAVATYADRLAAVLVEPVNVSAGLIAPADGFLQALRESCDRHNILLVFDETATGFRLGLGGAAARFKVRPDLAVHGPLLGGAMPLSACIGRKDVMQIAGREEHAAQWVRFSDNLLAMSAGLTTLQALAEPDVYQTLDAFSSHLKGGIHAAAKAAGIPVQINRVPGMLAVYFTTTPVTSTASARTADVGRYAAFHAAMLERDVFIPASPFAPWYLSTAHTAEHIDRAIEAAHDALDACKNA